MQGEKGAPPPELEDFDPSPRSRSMRFVLNACLWSLVLASFWLFASNLDQLFPALPSHTGAGGGIGALWRDGSYEAEFAGGLWHRADFRRSLLLTFSTATLTAVLAALVGIPASWALSRGFVPCGAFVETVVRSVIVLPASTLGLALIVLFQYGPLRWLQDLIGFDVMYSMFPGIIIAQGVLALAFGMSAWKAAFDAVDPRLERVAGALGATHWQAFREVTLPVSGPGMLAGFVLAWLRATAEFGAVLLFCGTFRELPMSRFGATARLLGVYKADLLSIAMWTEIEYGNVEYGMGIAFVLAAVSALAVFLLHRLGARGFPWHQGGTAILGDGVSR